MSYKDNIQKIDKYIEKVITIKYLLILLIVLLLWFMLLGDWKMSILFIMEIYVLIKLKDKYKKYMVED